MAVETKRPKPGALPSVEAGRHMHNGAQVKRAAAAGERAPDALRGHPLCPVYLPRPTRRGAAPWWWNFHGRTAAWLFGILRQRWVRRLGLGVAGGPVGFLLF